MSDAAVGSISHILKTAFKDVYQDYSKRDQAVKAREDALIEAEKARIKAEQEAALAAEAAAAEAAAAAKSKGKAPKKDDKKGKAEPEVVPEPVKEPEPPSATPPVDPSTLIENYYAPIETMKLDKQYKDMLESKTGEIKRVYEDKIVKADDLQSYLTAQRIAARLEEEKEEEELKRRGIMIGQHIPPLPSKLVVAKHRIDGYDNFSNNLVIAHDLVESNREVFLRRTGNLPISELAATRLVERSSKSQTTLDPKEPHYVSTTGNNAVRVAAVSTRFAKTLKVAEEEKAAKESKKVPRKKFPVRNDFLTPAQVIENAQILADMSHKQNYLRNPRNNPKAITKMLTKGKDAPKDATAGDLESVGSSVSGSDSATKKSYKKVVPVYNNPLFISEPKSVEFNGYEIGVPMTKTITLRNVSTISRSVRIWPTGSANFSLSPLQYPANCKGGYIAPGMCVTTVLTFIPDSLGDYLDSIKVETEGGGFRVPVSAQRESPVLNIPTQINVGVCLVGDASRAVLKCHNSGGVGKFRFLHPDNYPSVPVDLDWARMGCVRVAPFTVYPVEFTLNRNESIEVTIEYVPRDLGVHDSKVFLLCDNCQVQEVKISGSSRLVDVSVVEVNSVHVTDGESNASRHLMFSGSCIGAEQSQHLVVANTTGMPIEYEWVWMDLNATNLRKVALEKIALREDRDAVEALGSMEADFRDFTQAVATTPANGGFDASGLPVPPSRHTVESLMESLGEGKGDSNVAVEGEFSISPARGVFPADDIGVTFEITYSAIDLSLTSKRAVLMLKHTPHAALPASKSQQAALAKLKAEGHGDYHRLRSWLEEVGVVGTVPEYRRPNGDKSTSAKITSVQTILDMVGNHAAGVMTAFDQNRVKVWARLLILHAYACENRLLQLDDDDQDLEAEAGNIFASDSEGGKTEVILYNWEGDADQIPVPLYPVKLSIRGVDEYRNDGRSSEEWEVEDALVEANKHVLKTLWVDCWTATRLLERTVSQILDDRVRHEAVDYIKDCSQATVVCLNACVSGRGIRQVINVEPPRLQLPGRMSVGSVWNGKVLIRNTSSSMAEVEANLAEMRVKCLALDAYSVYTSANSLDSGFMVSSNYFQVELDPGRVLLLPESSVLVDVKVLALQTGLFELKIPLRTQNSFSLLDTVTIVVNVIGPRVHFAASEVDVGLVGVGAIEERVLTISNEGEVSCNFVLKCNLDAGESFSGMVGKQGGSLLDSRQNTSRSQRSDASGASGGSRDSFAIETPTTVVLIDPPAGTIEAGGSTAVVVKCKAGSVPQRVRGFIDCAITVDSGIVQLPTQVLSIRGEVQAPKTILYPMAFDLGKVFVSIPIYFDVFLENLCNLPTKFKFERPGGDAASYKISFDNPKGSLDQKELIKVRVEFVALTAGVIDDVIACKCFGVKHPLGFSFSAVARGIRLEFAPLLEGQPAPRPLALPVCSQYPGNGDPPDSVPIVPLEVGAAIPLYERRKVRFTIRNMSAIPTNFNLSIAKFIVKNFAANVSSSVSIADDGSIVEDSGERKDLIIAPHEDGTNKFRSEGGKVYIEERLQRREDKKYLQTGLGASYSIEPSTGKLGPWGVQVVTLKAFNDMPGCFDDDLYCSVMDGNGALRESVVPLKLSVTGCPLIIEKDSLGMSVVYESHGPASDVGKQLLQMGNACTHADPLVRTFTVRNNGSKPGKLKWKLKQSNMVMNGPMRVKVKVGEDGKVKTQFQFWSDLAHETAFKIEPDKAVIAPYGRQSFTVTLLRTELVGKLTGSLTGIIAFDEGLSKTMSKDTTLSDTAAASADFFPSSGAASYSLLLLMEGVISHPAIKIDKHVFEAADSPSLPPPEYAIKLRTQAPLLYATGNRPSEVCRKPITILNPLNANLMFSVMTEGPFTIKSSAPHHAEPGPSSGASVASGASSVGKPYFLLPNASTSFSVAFTPRRDLRETLTRVDSATSGSAKMAEQTGSLVFSFATGQSLRLPLVTQISTPFITASSPRLYFGVCHVTRLSEGTLLLSNPTDVTASWSVTHVPGAGAQVKKTAIRVKGFADSGPETDDPSVFEISPTVGQLLGPTVSVAAAVAAPPKDFNRQSEESVVTQRLMESSWASGTLTLADSVHKRQVSHTTRGADACFPAPITIKFHPKKNVNYSSRFRFVCDFGNSFDVLLVGQGTYEEHEHNPVSPAPRG